MKNLFLPQKDFIPGLNAGEVVFILALLGSDSINCALHRSEPAFMGKEKVESAF